jgi:DNA-binding XRE family transcriptional regulator
MDPSRIGIALADARARLGWSRETLAFHSGLSWSAIAQIESGRRADVRLSSLTALAAALGVSLDYLAGAVTPHIGEHHLLPYSTTEDFLSTAGAFASSGLDRSHAVLAVTSPANIGLLRERLAGRADLVDFVDSQEWYVTPPEALSRYDRYVKEKFAAGAPWVRVLGEPMWTDRSAAEISAWTRYESMINIAFASAPATIACPYDVRSLPPSVVADAHRTHPHLARPDDSEVSPNHVSAGDFLLAIGD